ncbi:hypothetical protein BJV82DRAFT_515726 [Fennellomyces sp. T-0311]|nr:hypothetical protein BJV82DRAFT_515726 [Fennellomyces sp. T-0311]
MTDNPIPEKILDSLRRHSLFQRSNNQEFLERIACRMIIRTYAPRDVIIVQGEKAKAMFLLLRGAVDVCSADFERIFATLHGGSCFGEIGLLYAIPRTATVIAAAPCTVAVLTADAVAAILPDYPDVEQVLRFEAQERMAMLEKSKHELKRSSSAGSVDSFIATGAYDHLAKVNVPFFKGCPEDFMHRISLMVEPKSYLPNKTIISKNDIGNEMFFIIDGTIGTVQVINSRGGTDIAVARLGPGDFFGEIAILLDIPRTADVRSITALELYVLSKKDFMHVCQDYPELERWFKTLADKALKAIDTFVRLQLAGVTYVPEEEQDYSASLAPIDTSAVCSTTSDQDPTLPTNVNRLKERETRPRRPSIAVWSDPSLLAAVDKSTKRRSITISEASPISPSTTQERDRLTALDTSILARVATLLDFASMIRFSGTCRKFYHTFHTPDQWQKLDLGSSNRLMTDETIEVLADMIGPNVEFMYLTHCFHLTDQAILTLVDRTPQIRKLDLNSCWLITDKSMEALGTLRHLEWLDLSNCRKITNQGIRRLLEQNPRIKHLTLSYCKNLTDQAMYYFAKYATDDLESLNLQRCTKITDQGFVHWFNEAPHAFARLRTLDLTDCSFLTDKAIAHLVVAAPYLENLSLSFCCALSDTSLEELTKLSRLAALDASYCGAAVSDASISALIKATWRTLKRLNIRGCVRVSGIGLMMALEYAQLQYLNISQCPGISRQIRSCFARSGHIDYFYQ